MDRVDNIDGTDSRTMKIVIIVFILCNAYQKVKNLSIRLKQHI